MYIATNTRLAKLYGYIGPQVDQLQKLYLLCMYIQAHMSLDDCQDREESDNI